MSNDTITGVRTFEVGEFEFERESGGDGRMITMQAVPFGVTVPIPSEGIRERFARGAFAHQLSAMHRVVGTYRHQSQGGEVIGRLHDGEELASGLRVRMRVSDTQRGNDTLTLVRDGAIRQVSIGFRAQRAHSRVVEGVTERTRADLFEVALLPEGAYGRHATVTGIRTLDDLFRAASDDEGAQDEGEGMSLREALDLARSIPLLPASIIGR